MRRVSSHGRKTDPGVLLLFWGNFGGRAPTAVGDQSYLGPVYGEYLGYPSDPYRPHTLEHSPPSDFGPVYVFLVPFASPEDDFSGDVDNFRRVVPRVVDKEARSLLFKYMGDLYRVATDIFGEPLQSFNGAGSELGGVVFGSVYRALYWCTPSPFRHKPPVGIRYRIFTNCLDERLLGCSAVQTALFWFNVPGQSQFFGPKRLAPDTVVFSNSLRDPVSVN